MSFLGAVVAGVAMLLVKEEKEDDVVVVAVAAKEDDDDDNVEGASPELLYPEQGASARGSVLMRSTTDMGGGTPRAARGLSGLLIMQALLPESFPRSVLTDEEEEELEAAHP